jgi:hypothetical protein
VIPPFRRITGDLPPGVHMATWPEFVLRYGYNKPRQRLLVGLAQAIKDLRAAGCQRIYVDGSFVTDTPEPGDFDCCWEEANVDASLLPGELLDIFPAHGIADLLGTSFLEYFQLNKNTGKRRGIVAINLQFDNLEVLK